MRTMNWKNIMKKKWIMIPGILVIILIVFLVARGGGNKYQFVAAARANITETVSVTGNTTPVQSLDLAFQNGGTVAEVLKNAGESVHAGDEIARLDTRDLETQLAQANANVAAAQAKLDGLKAGSTPENVQVSRAAVASAEQTLENAYANIPSTVTDALAKSNDAIRNQISPFYSDPESRNPSLTFSVSDNQIANNANTERLAASTELNAWQTELAAMSANSPTSTLAQALTNATAHIAIIQNLLSIDSNAVVNATGLSASTAATYKTDLADAVTEINSASTAVSGAVQSIASENAAVAEAQAQLSVTLAGPTPQDIAAQVAAVAQTQANASQIKVKIDEATLASPIDGIVTTQNAKVGEVAPAGETMTSIISENNLEVDADVPETDVGKLAEGNRVSMTFDAFPGETFTGKVFYINPGETIVSGVVEYQTKISFDKPDPRMKSGLTANLSIETATHENTIVVPQYAVIQNASGTFVEVIQGGKPVQIPVSLGLRDQNGNVEIVSGISEGQKLVNIGLKTQ